MNKLKELLNLCMGYAKRHIRGVLNALSGLMNRYLSDRKGYQEVLKLIDQMPQSNGTRIFARENVRVGIVADTFVLENFAPTCHLVNLMPDQWESQLEGLDCVLIVSAWRGVSTEWMGLAKHGSAISRKLIALMKAAKAAGLPVLFYSKEDPPNYHVFLPYAQQADYIFTSAQEAVERYNQDCPGIPVQVLTFAVNPMLHNPIGSQGVKKEKTVFFAGSWMPKYPDRIRMQKLYFKWIRRAGMKFSIADRNFNRKEFRYCYPLRYIPSVMSSFTYHQVSALYKIFPWIMNFNSVNQSQTMFAMRVYDACACGAHVISNESPGMERIFPEVHVIHSYEDLHNAVTKSPELLTKEKNQAIRRIMAQDTVFNRMRQMLETAGIQVSDHTLPLIGVLLDPKLTDEEKTLCREMFEAQSWENKRLAETMEELSGCRIVTLWGPDRSYGEYYLEDMACGFKYTACDYITKSATAQAHTYCDRIDDPYATLFWVDAEKTPLLTEIPKEGMALQGGYVSDRENYRYSNRD